MFWAELHQKVTIKGNGWPYILGDWRKERASILAVSVCAKTPPPEPLSGRRHKLSKEGESRGLGETERWEWGDGN